MTNDFSLNVIARLNKLLSERQLRGDLKSLDNKLYVKVLARLSKTLATKELKKQLKELNKLYVQVGMDVQIDNKTKEELQKNIHQLQQMVSDLEIGLKISKNNVYTDVETVQNNILKKIHSTPIEFNLQVKKDTLLNDIQYLAKQYSKLFSNASATEKYEKVLNHAYGVSDLQSLNDTRAELKLLTSELKLNGLAVKSTADKWKGLIERSKEIISAAAIIRVVFSQVKESINTFLELDTSMTGLYKVQNDIASRDQFSGLLSRWNKLAQELSVTTKSLIDSSAEWSKIGFNLNMSEELAKITAIFEKTAEITNQQASATLISAAQAFTEIDDFGEEDYIERVEAIGNKINAIGNKYAISSEGIAEALQNSSASLKMANNDLDESIALIASANKIFQSPSEVGNMLKVVSARLRGQKGELEELNEDTDDLLEGVSKVQTQILNLTHNRVNIFENDNETLKSTYEIMQEIGSEIDNMSDKDSANLLEIIFGKQRMSSGASLLLNIKELEAVKKDSMDAANSMAEEYSKYLESAEAHIIRFKEKLVETYSSFMSGDLIKFSADAGSAMLDLVNHTDLLRHSLLGIASIKIGKGITTIGASIASATKQMNDLGSALQKVRSLPLDTVLRKDILVEVGNATAELSEKNLKLLLSEKSLTEIDRTRILAQRNLTEEEIRAKLAKMGLTNAVNAQSNANVASTATTLTLKNAMISLKTAAVGLGKSLKALVSENPIGFALMAVTTIVSAATSAISSHKQAVEEMRDKAKEAADEANSLGDEISELANKYIQLSEAVGLDSSAKDELLDTQTELLKKLNMEGESVDALIEKYGSLSAAIKQVSIDTLKEKQIDLIASIEATKAELLEEAREGLFTSKNSISATGKEAGKAWQILEDAGLISAGMHTALGGEWSLPGDESTIEGTLESFEALKEALEALGNAEVFTSEELADNLVYQKLYARYSELKDRVEAYTVSVENLNENLAQQTVLSSLQNKEMPKTAEKFEIFKKELIDTAIASRNFIGNEKEITAVMNNYLAKIPEFQGFYSIPLEKELGKVSEILSETEISGIVLSKDDVKVLQEYQNNIESIASSLSDLSSLNTNDILSVMTEFSEYADIFEKYGVNGVQGVGDLEGALKELANTLMTAAVSACPQMEDAIKRLYSEMVADAESADAFIAEYRELDAVIQKVKSGQALSSSEISVLIGKYGDLSKVVSATTDGYTIEIDILESLKDSKEEEARSAIAWQMKQTEEAIENTRKRIKAYELETKSLNALTQSYTNNKFSTIDDYISEYGEKAAVEVFGDDALEEYNQYLMDKAQVDIYTSQLEKLRGELEHLGSISSSSSSSSSKSETIFDWIDTRIKRTEEFLERLNTKLEAVSDYTSQNAYIDEMLSGYDKEIQVLDEARNKYLALADAVGLSAAYIEKIKNGTLDIETVTDEVIKKKISSYQDWYEKALDVEKSIDDTKKKIKELNKQKLDNIINDYERVLKLTDAYRNYQQTLLDIKELQSGILSESDYNAAIQSVLNKQATIQQEYNDTLAEFKKLDLTPADDEWYDYQEELVGFQDEMNQCTLEVEKFRDSILEIRWDTFEKGMDSLSNLSDEISDVMSMFDGMDMFKDGEITDAGITKLGLYAQKYVAAKKQIAEYNNAIYHLGEMYKNGSITLSEYNEKLVEFQSAQRDAMLSVKDMKDAILDFNEEAIQAELDAMKELIDAKKDALDAEKDLHDYQQSITKKQKSIAALQHRIAVLAGSDARKDKALRLQLEEELAKLQEELANEQREHAVEEQKDALDEEYEAYEKEKQDELSELRNNLDKQNDLIESYLQKVENNYDIVYDNINKLSNEFGINFTDSLTSPWESATNAAQLYADFVGKVMAELEINSSKLQDMTGTSLGSQWSDGKGESSGSAGEWIKDGDRWWYKHSDGGYTKDNWEQIDGRWYHFDKDGWMEASKWIDDTTKDGNWYYVGADGAMLSNTTTPDGYQVDSHGAWIKNGNTTNKGIQDSIKVSDITGNIKFGDRGEDVKTLQTALEALGYSVGQHGIDGKFGSDTLAAVKAFQSDSSICVDGIVGTDTKYKFKLRGYRNGLINNPVGQLAIVDEVGEELIAHAGKDGRLEYLTKGSSVIPSDFTKRLMDVAYNANKYVNMNTPKFDIVNRQIPSPVVNITSPLIQVDGGLDSRMLGEMKRMVDDIPNQIRKQMKMDFITKGLR